MSLTIDEIRALLVEQLPLDFPLGKMGGPVTSVPAFKVESPDHGDGIKDLAAYVRSIAPHKRFIIVADGGHQSLEVQRNISAVIKAANPQSLALEFQADDLPPANRADALKQIKTLYNDRQAVMDPAEFKDFSKVLDIHKERFEGLNDKVKLKFIETRTPAESTALMEAENRLYELRETELKKPIAKDEMAVLQAQQQEALKTFVSLNKKFEVKAIDQILDVAGENGTCVAVVGLEHIRKKDDIEEELVRHGIPKDQIAVISIRPVEELPPKAMQKGGDYNEAATIFVEDKKDGLPIGTIVAEGRILDSKQLNDIQNISDVIFVEGTGAKNEAGRIGVKLIADKTPLGSVAINDVAFSGMSHPVAKKIRLRYGPTNDGPFTDLNISDLPVKDPGQELTAQEKKAWIGRLQESLAKLKKDAEKSKTAPGHDASISALVRPDHGLSKLAKWQGAAGIG